MHDHEGTADKFFQIIGYIADVLGEDNAAAAVAAVSALGDAAGVIAGHSEDFREALLKRTEQELDDAE